MLIVQIALLVLGLESLLAWCWSVGAIETQVLALAHISMLGGVAVANRLRARPTCVSIGWSRDARAPNATKSETHLRRAA
jgi:hypothetical protein